MKKLKQFIQKLKRYAVNESKEVKDFVERFEKETAIDNTYTGHFTRETYQLYLETPLWKAIRTKVFRLKGRRCEGCGSRDRLVVHHTSYKPKVINGESLVGLRVVCRDCHDAIHKLTRGKISLTTATRLILKS